MSRARPATPRGHRSFLADFRRFFLRGLAILLPSILTLWILWYAFAFLFKTVAEPINRGLRAGVVLVLPMAVGEPDYPSWYRVSEEQLAEARAARRPGLQKAVSDDVLRWQVRREELEEVWQIHWYLSGAGLIVAVVLVYLVGVLLGGVIGRTVYSRLERLISRVPGVKQIYPHAKQLVDLLIGDMRGGAMSPKSAFKRVVLVEFPHPNCWSIGFVTGPPVGDVERTIGKPCVTVYVPSTPTPFTGYTVTAPADRVFDVAISIDEALRYMITAGVLSATPSPPGRPSAVIAGGAAPGEPRAAEAGRASEGTARAGAVGATDPPAAPAVERS